MAIPSETGNHQEQLAHVFVNNNVLILNMYWTPEEQATLEDGLKKYASLPNSIRYGMISLALNDKTPWDVSLRVSWINKKKNSKRRKDGHNLSRKSKDKKERVSNPAAKSSQFSARPNVPPYAPVPQLDNADDIPYAAIGGPTAELLEQNKQALSQISAKFSPLKFQENNNLLCQIRDNFIRVMNEMDDSPVDDSTEVMKKMKPLTLKINEEVANSILALPPLYSLFLSPSGIQDLSLEKKKNE